MTSHEFARRLMALPDCPVVGIGTGQGSNEMGDDDLHEIKFIPDYKTNKAKIGVIGLFFGGGEITGL